jgi:epoxide hydrolase-like predicted phosphatase
MTNYKAVIFDLGGVVVGSPWPGIVAYEQELGTGRGELGKYLDYANGNGLFAQLERNEITFDAYCKGAEEAFAKNYLGDDILPFSGRKLVEAIEEACSTTDAKIIRTVDELRKRGILCAVITNNWYNTKLAEVLPTHEQMFASTPEAHQKHMKELMGHFDLFVESRKQGKRKPEVSLYKHTLEELNKIAGTEIRPNQVIFIDDIGSNLKPMKELGVHTILARGTDQVLKDMESALNMTLH